MKKVLIALVILLAAFSTVFAVGGKEGAESSTLAAIKAKGKIVLGTSADFPPYEFHISENGNDKIVGFDIAVGQAVADALGVKLEIKDMNFDGLLAALVSGNVDIVVAGLSPTAERKQSIDFSVPYYYAQQGAMIRKEDAAKYTTIESLKDVVVGAQKGAIQMGIAKKQIKGLSDETVDHPQIKGLGKLGDLTLALKNKNIEAVIVETTVAEAYVSANPELMVAPFFFEQDENGSAIGIKKGQEDLVEAINAVIKELTDSNKMGQMIIEANDLMSQL